MAIFLRGNIWWFEYRTRKERVVKSTRLPKNKKREAQAVFDAFKLARSTGVARSAIEKILEAIYTDAPKDSEGVPLDAVYLAYVDWQKGKGRKLADKTVVEQKGLINRFVAWATEQKCRVMEDVDVSITRRYIDSLRKAGKANKTLRNAASTLGHVWEAVSQLRGRVVSNPWKAAMPDDDGSSVRREAFTVEQEEAVLKACDTIGNDWRLASIIARWTGLRYGDVANLEWADVDWERGVIDTMPSKTKKHKVRVVIPMSEAIKTALRPRMADGKGFILPRHAMTYPMPMCPSFTDVLELAGLDTSRYTFHSWRHTFRTRLAEAGVSDDIARRLGGWTNLEMAAHYDHAQRIGDLRHAIESMQK